MGGWGIKYIVVTFSILKMRVMKTMLFSLAIKENDAG